VFPVKLRHMCKPFSSVYGRCVLFYMTGVDGVAGVWFIQRPQAKCGHEMCKSNVENADVDVDSNVNPNPNGNPYPTLALNVKLNLTLTIPMASINNSPVYFLRILHVSYPHLQIHIFPQTYTDLVKTEITS